MRYAKGGKAGKGGRRLQPLKQFLFFSFLVKSPGLGVLLTSTPFPSFGISKGMLLEGQRGKGTGLDKGVELGSVCFVGKRKKENLKKQKENHDAFEAILLGDY